MRIFCATLFSIFVIVGAVPAHAQLQDVSENRIQIYGAGALMSPYAPERFSQPYHAGYGGTMGIGITLTPNWELSLKGSYTSLNLDEDGYRLFSPGSTTRPFNGGMQIYSAELGLKYLIAIEGSWAPYFIAGVGAYHREEQDIEVIIVEQSNTSMNGGSRTLQGGFAGFGLAYRIADPISAYVEPRYVATTSFGSVNDYMMDHASMQIGVLFNLF